VTRGGQGYHPRPQDAKSELEGYDAAAASMGRLDSPTERGRISLVSDLIWSAQGSSERHVAYLGPWLTRQIGQGAGPIGRGR
jgi:hypothetical protein